MGKKIFGFMLLIFLVSVSSSESRKMTEYNIKCVKVSDLFRGPCVEQPPCTAACNQEGWPQGDCLLQSGPFTDLVCFCKRC